MINAMANAPYAIVTSGLQRLFGYVTSALLVIIRISVWCAVARYVRDFVFSIQTMLKFYSHRAFRMRFTVLSVHVWKRTATAVLKL